jgi:hypothetical protein
MAVKEELHRLVEELPECELHTAKRFLVYLRAVSTDPVLRAFLEAPEDDEPVTAEEETAIEEARAEMARGEGIPWEVVEARLFPKD